MSYHGRSWWHVGRRSRWCRSFECTDQENKGTPRGIPAPQECRRLRIPLFRFQLSVSRTTGKRRNWNPSWPLLSVCRSTSRRRSLKLVFVKLTRLFSDPRRNLSDQEFYQSLSSESCAWRSSIVLMNGLTPTGRRWKFLLMLSTNLSTGHSPTFDRF